MTRGKSGQRRRPVRRIAINGQNLDEIRTVAATPPASGTAASIGFPVEHHEAIEDGIGVTLRVPVVTALQLLYDGILPQDRTRAASLTVGGKTQTPVYFQGLTVVSDPRRQDTVLLRFASQPPISITRYVLGDPIGRGGANGYPLDHDHGDRPV